MRIIGILSLFNLGLIWALFELQRMPYNPPHDMSTFLGTEIVYVRQAIIFLSIVQFLLTTCFLFKVWRFAASRFSQRRPAPEPDGEISYDLVLAPDMTFSEGCYRVGDGPWSVVIISKRPIEATSWNTSTWESGVSGIVMYVPLNTQLNMETIESLLSEVLGVKRWNRVNGPDSTNLR